MHRRVLVVEDDADLREALVGLLVAEGHEVEGVGDGRAALESMRARRPDVVVLDLMLPIMDGWEVLAVQRSEPGLAEIPVVVVSGNATPVAAAAHADLYLVKPLDARTIMQAVTDVVSNSERRRHPARLAHIERLAAIGTLAAGISHEITNPLTYLLLQLKKTRAFVGKANANDADELDDMLAGAIEAAERISAIAHDVAAFSRADDASEREIVDLGEVARCAIRLVRHRIQHLAMLETDDGVVPPVFGSEGRLVQVFMNLLVNATQALPQEGAATHVIRVVSGTDDAGWAFVEVADNGRGIPGHLLGRIFEPFFTTKAAGEGTGLGLALCNDIVSALGGEILVASEEGRGTRFRVRLPPAAVTTGSRANRDGADDQSGKEE